jgi:hypothetical protein
MKHIAVKDSGYNYIPLFEIEKCSFVPAGWTKSSKSFALGDWSMKHPIIHPPKQVPAMVYIPNCTTLANNCRIVPDEVEKRIGEIDEQIKQLHLKRRQLLEDEFLTFPLVQPSDLKQSQFHKRYTTKKEAGKING